MEGTAKIEEFIRIALEHMQIAGDISSSTDEAGALQVAVQTPEHGNLLIGKNGQNLKALEHIARTIWARGGQMPRAITIDVNGYRAERTQELARLVKDTALRVQQTRKSEALDPMTSYERRVVHTELAAYSDLVTESIGQEPYRRVVIKPL
jgi:spoIIIJ-associated protein